LRRSPTFAPTTGARDTAQEFVNAFRLFDRKGTGKLEVGLVRRILESFKHPLSPQGIDDLIGQVELDSQGCLDYRDFVKQLLDF
jgi:calmodulin